jgi:conjugal transfer ATP-binding protein TraC
VRRAVNYFSKIGQKVANLLGEQNHCIPEIGGIQDILNTDMMAKLLPFESFDIETGLFISRNSIGFAIEAMPLVGGDKHHQRLIESIFEDFFHEKASMQFLLLADPRIKPFLDWWGQSKVKGIVDEATSHRRDFFEKGTFAVRNFRFFVSYSLPYSGSYANEAQILSDIRKKMLQLFQTVTASHGMGPQAFLETTGSMLNFKLSPELIRRRHNVLEDLSSQLMEGGETRVEKDGLYFDEKIAFKSFYVSEMPSCWSLETMGNLIGDIEKDNYRLNFPFFLHYGVHFPEQAKAEKNFNMRSRLVENQGKSSYLIRMIPELANELRECDKVRRELIQGAKFVWTQFSCGFWTHKENKDEAEQSLRNLFKIHQFGLIENRYMHLPHLISILPTTWGEMANELKNMNVLKTTLSTECPLFVPIHGEWSGTATQGMLFVGRRGQLLNWNPFDNKGGNYNTIVSGSSGGGKSVFMQDLLLNGFRVGVKIFILDVGRSYKKLCDLVGGQEIEFSRKSNICLNPFSKIKLDDPEEKETAFIMLKSIISCMATTGSEEKYESSLIEIAIQKAWEKKNRNATITCVANELLSMNDDKARILGIMLGPYTKTGMYSKYFEGENNVDFTNPLVVIELEELKGKEDLQAVILQMFIMDIANRAFLGDRKTPFYICIDEAWDLLRAPQTGKFIETLARRLRKYKGALIVGTQGVEDFFSTPGSKAAFENSDWMCFLSQKDGSVQSLAESGKLPRNPGLIKAISSVIMQEGNYSEVVISNSTNGNYSIGRLKLDPFSHLLYTTKAEEFTRVKDLTESGMTISQAIQELIKEKQKYEIC